jgi:hypothetical protein
VAHWILVEIGKAPFCEGELSARIGADSISRSNAYSTRVPVSHARLLIKDGTKNNHEIFNKPCPYPSPFPSPCCGKVAASLCRAREDPPRRSNRAYRLKCLQYLQSLRVQRTLLRMPLALRLRDRMAQHGQSPAARILL